MVNAILADAVRSDFTTAATQHAGFEQVQNMAGPKLSFNVALDWFKAAFPNNRTRGMFSVALIPMEGRMIIEGVDGVALCQTCTKTFADVIHQLEASPLLRRRVERGAKNAAKRAWRSRTNMASEPMVASRPNKPRHWCTNHGPNNSHTTENCQSAKTRKVNSVQTETTPVATIDMEVDIRSTANGATTMAALAQSLVNTSSSRNEMLDRLQDVADNGLLHAYLGASQLETDVALSEAAVQAEAASVKYATEAAEAVMQQQNRDNIAARADNADKMRQNSDMPTWVARLLKK